MENSEEKTPEQLLASFIIDNEVPGGHDVLLKLSRLEEEANKIKVIDKYDSIFKNFALTDLVVIKRGKRTTPFGKHYVICELIDKLLSPYGIGMFGGTYLMNNDESHTDIQLYHINISKDMPVENELIFKELYGWDNSWVDIGLEANDDCAYSFLYHTDKYNCILRKQVYGRVDKSRTFDTFSEMMAVLKMNKSIEKAFDL